MKYVVSHHGQVRVGHGSRARTPDKKQAGESAAEARFAHPATPQVEQKPLPLRGSRTTEPPEGGSDEGPGTGARPGLRARPRQHPREQGPGARESRRSSSSSASGCSPALKGSAASTSTTPPRPARRRRGPGAHPVLGRAGHALGRRPPGPGRGIVLATAGTLVTAGLVGGVVLLVTGLPALSPCCSAPSSRPPTPPRSSPCCAPRAGAAPGRVRDLLKLGVGQQRPDGGLPHRQPHIASSRKGAGLSAELAGDVPPADGPRAPLGFVAGAAMAWAIDRIDLDSRALPRARPRLVLLTFGATRTWAAASSSPCTSPASSGGPGLHPQAQPDPLPRRPRLAHADRHVPDPSACWSSPAGSCRCWESTVVTPAFLTLAARPLGVYFRCSARASACASRPFIGVGGAARSGADHPRDPPAGRRRPGGRAAVQHRLLHRPGVDAGAGDDNPGGRAPGCVDRRPGLRARTDVRPACRGRDLVEYRVPATRPSSAAQIGRRVCRPAPTWCCCGATTPPSSSEGSTRLRRDDVLSAAGRRPGSLRAIDVAGELVREPSSRSASGRAAPEGAACAGSAGRRRDASWSSATCGSVPVASGFLCRAPGTASHPASAAPAATAAGTGASVTPQYLRPNHSATLTRPISTGTSTSGPMTAAKASPEFEAEHGDRDGDGEFEVVARRREGEGRGLGVVGADAPAHPEAHQEHDHEVDEQRHRDQQTSSGSCTIRSPLRLNITTIVNSRAISVSGLMRGMNCFSYHSRPLSLSPRNA